MINDFKTKLVESFVGNISVFGLEMLFPLVVAQLYGSEILGKYTYGYSIVMMTIFFASLGLDMGLLYFIPREGNRYVTASFILNLFSSIVIVLALLVFIDDHTVRLMLPLIWFMSAEQLFFTLYRTKQNIKEFFKVKALVSLGLKIFLTAVFFKFYGVNVFGLVLATYISAGISLILYYIKQRDMFETFEIKREVISYSLPLIVGSMMSVIISNIDMVMIGNLLSKQDVAVYSVAARIAVFPSILLTVFNTVFPPIAAKLYHDGDIEQLGNIYKASAKKLAAISSVIIITMILFRQEILSLFGPEFIAGEYVIIFRGIGQLINASVGSVWYIVCMTGRPKVNMVGKILAATLNVIFNILLIPVLGITGAALASMIAVGFANILGYIIVKNILQVKVFGFV